MTLTDHYDATALLAAQGLFEESEAVFRADLQRYPANLWSLRGLTICMSKNKEAKRTVATIEKEAAIAATRCEVAVTSACLCAVPPLNESCCGRLPDSIP